ncbi:MAG: RDD family protein [Chloroflexi bacterium ADurb.Bin360]|nr:MAG: RDD family protein [Chloroflexi bacterium ADurb.Bin360]
MAVAERAYPSVWRRICAYLVDYGLLFGVLIPLQLLLYRVGRGFPYNLLQNGLQIELWIWLSVSLPAWLYFALSESSPRQGTFGKRLLGLQVADLQGDRIGFGRALLRTVIKLLPWELTHLSLMLPVPMWWDPQPTLRPEIVGVYALVGVYLVTLFLNPRRQSVHDLVARTVVVSWGKAFNHGTH